MENVFKNLVKIEIASIVLFIGLGFSGYTTLPDELINYSDYLIEEHWIAYLSVIPILILWIVSCFMLLYFKSAGRTLYLWTTVAAVLWGFFIGPQIYDQLTYVLDTIGSMLSGGIIALMYFSSVKDRFN